MKKRLLSIFLTITMICTLIPALGITASAATTRCGISANWQGTSSWQSSGYYYLTSDYTITKSGNSNVAVSGTLYLDLNGHTITFKGSSNYAAIDIKNGSTLYLYDSSNGSGAIKRDSSAGYANGVYIDNATFVMNGGTISGFKNASDGGGVRVYNYGSFTMNGGRICDNAASNSGGGVGVSDNSSFKMTGGSIYSNNTKNTSQYVYGGGGVALWYGASFEMTGGDIYSNNSVQFGGGVMHNSTGAFKMTSGRIDWNTANGDGGGIYCCGGSLTMSGGYIYSNSATYSGGGVAVCSGVTFNMSGGNIYSNKTTTYRAESGGGGVALWGKAKFNMTGGKMYDNSTASYGGAVMSNNDGTKVTINGGEIGSNTGSYTSGIRKCGGNGSVTYTSGRFYIGNNYNPSLSGTSTITLNKNDGSGTTASVSGQSWNTVMKSATMPTRDGYTFNGYYNATSGGDQYYTSTGASARNWDYIGAQTLYAQWTEHTATLTYNANGHGTAPNAVTMKYTAATNAAAALSEDYYTFQNWNTKPDGTGTAYAAGEQIKAANDDPAAMTLYAQWTPNTYPVTLDNGEGSGETSVTATYGAAMPKVTAPTWDKHVFQGYFTQQGEAYYDANGESVKVWDQDSDSVTLYAHWADSAKIEDLSLELDGDIGMRFHSTVNEEALKTGYMTMSVGGKAAKTQTVHYNETEKDSTGKAIFSFDVSAIELAEKITANFYDENGTLYDTASESVEDYYGLLKEDAKVAADAKAVVKALVNYGHFAQQALSKTRGWVIGSDYAATAKQNDLTATAEDLKAYSPIIIGNDDHVKGIGMSLLLDNKTTLCLYLTTSDGEMPHVRVDGGGELIPIEYDETANVASQYIERMSDGRWLVRIPNIDAVNLGTIHKVTADGRTIYLSALSYGSVITGEENVNAICALYEYYQAALQYAKLQEITSATAQDASYTGSAIEPVLTVMSGDTQLTDSAYQVEWFGDRTEVGTHIGIVTAKSGNLVGGALVQFTVNG